MRKENYQSYKINKILSCQNSSKQTLYPNETILQYFFYNFILNKRQNSRIKSELQNTRHYAYHVINSDDIFRVLDDSGKR